MKGKRVYIFLILFLLAGVPKAFSQGLSLEALPVSNGIVEVHNNESFQTVYTKSGIGLTVGAKAVDSAIRYDFEIVNDTNKDFFFDLDNVEAFGGNHKKHKWTPYIIYDSPSAIPLSSRYEQTSNEEKDDAALAKGLVAGVAIVAVTVGAFLLFDKLRDSNDSDSSITSSSSKKEKDKKSETYKKPPRKHKPDYRPVPHHHDIVDDILFWSFIDSMENRSNANNMSVNGSVYSLNSKRIRAGEKYYASFYVPYTNKDCKFAYTLPDGQHIELVFLGNEQYFVNNSKSINASNNSTSASIAATSDLDSKSESNSDSKGASERKLAINLSFNPIGGGGVYVMSLGQPLGAYFSTGMYFTDFDKTEIGYIKRHAFSSFVPKDLSNSYDYIFSPDGKYNRDVLNLNGGLTVKLTDYAWLLAGCGVDITFKNYYGSVYSRPAHTTEEYSYYAKGYAADKSPVFVAVPQIGLDFSYGYIDFGAMYKYNVKEGHMVDLMFGICF